METEIKAAIFGINRLRVGIDGPGVTTLVCFMGCPLNCKYCINDFCHEEIYEQDGITPRRGISIVTPQELYEAVKIDNIYFQSTGGGICFSGGEPGIQWRFIEEFRRICDPKWKLTIETSLCLNSNIISRLNKVVDHWIVDIKSLNTQVYMNYTGHYPFNLQNLYWLRHTVDPARVTIKVPHIPDFTSEENVQFTLHEMREDFKFTDVVECQYIRPKEMNSNR